MKTIITGFVALFLVLFSFSFALAENESANDSAPMLISAPAEINDINESEANGNFFWKQMDIWFTFNQEKKAEKELKLAELQLIRARIAGENNNTRAMEKALEAHKKLLERFQERVSKIENKNVSDKFVGLDRAIQVHQTRLDRFNALLNNLNLSDEQREKIQERIEQSQDNTEHLREVASERRLEFEKKLRERNASDDNSENKNDSLDDLNDDSNKSEDNSNDFNESDDDSEDDASGTVLSGSGRSGNAYS